jgi:response regulator RpfG family c-di-GMP phosphodiesterase
VDLISRVRELDRVHGRMMILLMSGAVPADALGGLALCGADDFLAKPYSPAEFVSRVKALFQRHSSLGERSTEITGTSAAPGGGATPPPQSAATVEVLAFGVARMLGEANLISPGYAARMSRYVRTVAAAVSADGEYRRLRDDGYVGMLASTAALHDLGLLALSHNILMKPTRLDADEVTVVQTHPTVGCEVLTDIASRYPELFAHLSLAGELVRHHHERWDGNGYPDQLAGADIPLSARLVAIAAVYDALRSRRPYRPPLSHARAVKLIVTESTGQFDPTLLAAFAVVAPRFDQIFQNPNGT